MLNKKSILLLTGSVLVILSLFLVNPYQKIINHQVISWDGAGYYLYLPSAFIYHDFKSLGYIHKIFYQYPLSSSFYQAFKIDNGNYVMNYPMGTSILQLPFFFIAHIITSFTSYPADGFSTPYQFMIVVAGLFYCLFGIVLLYKLLANYFGKTAALVACFSIFLGTNLYNYAYTEPCMSHVYLFFLVCAVLYLTDKWFLKATVASSALFGLAIGLILITRPTVGIVLIIPLLWKVSSLKQFIQNLKYIASNWKYVLIAIFIALLPVGLEMSYWKWITGYWLFNTYAYQHIGFDFKIKPFLYGLIGMQKGWFVYTPLICLMFISLFAAKKIRSPFLLPVAIYIIADICIVFSWQFWNYGGGFSARAMVESYAVLALPYAEIIKTALVKRVQASLLFIFISFCCLLNLFQTWQYNVGIIPPPGLAGMYEYEKFFFKTNRDIIPVSYLNNQGLVLPAHIKSSTLLLDTTYSGERSCDSSHLYFVAKFYAGKEIKTMGGNRLRFTAVTGYHDSIGRFYRAPASMFIGFERRGSMYFVKNKGIPESYTSKAPGTEVIELQVPETLKDNDVCKFYVTNESPEPLIVFKQKIEMLQVK